MVSLGELNDHRLRGNPWKGTLSKVGRIGDIWLCSGAVRNPYRLAIGFAVSLTDEELWPILLDRSCARSAWREMDLAHRPRASLRESTVWRRAAGHPTDLPHHALRAAARVDRCRSDRARWQRR